MSDNCKVIVITRFAVPHPSAPRKDMHLEPEWLARRCALLERYTLPSLLNQTDQCFDWWLLMDRRVSDGFWSRRSQGWPGMPVFVPDDWQQVVPGRRFDYHGPRHDWNSTVATVRLDSDDCLARDFVALVKKLQRPEGVLSFPEGAMFSCATQRRPFNDVRSRTWTANPFLVRYETGVNVEGVYALGDHSKVEYDGLVTYGVGSSEPMWLQVCHGGNISNDINDTGGDTLDPVRLGNRFGVDLR